MAQEGKGTGRKRGRPRKNPEATQQVKDQEGSEDMVQETEVVEEEIEEVIPVGTDSGLLFATEETKTLELIFKGQKWVLLIKILLGAIKMRVLTKLRNGKTGNLNLA